MKTGEPSTLHHLRKALIIHQLLWHKPQPIQSLNGIRQSQGSVGKGIFEQKQLWRFLPWFPCLLAMLHRSHSAPAWFTTARWHWTTAQRSLIYPFIWLVSKFEYDKWKHVNAKYRAPLIGGPQVLWILFLLLLTTSASTCLQHSHNLGPAY